MNIYTKSLFQRSDIDAPSTAYSDPVPTGHIWLIRLLSARVAGDSQFNNGLRFGKIDIDANEWYFWNLTNQVLQADQVYEFETRRVMTPGEILYVTTYDAGWWIDVTGWDLLSP